MKTWKTLDFLDAFDDATSLAEKVEQQYYCDSGILPIIDQGQSFIAGYMKEDALSWKGQLPVIIFGDHTRSIKYVDFQFVLGADGTKVLIPKAIIFPLFAYYWLISSNIPSLGYSRHFKLLKDLKISFPTLLEQQRIAAILQKADRLRRLRRYARTLSDTYLQSVFLEMFGDPGKNEKGWDIVSLKELISRKDTINYGVVQPGDDFPGGIPIVRVGDFDDIPEITNNLKRIDPLIEKDYKRSRLKGDEILVACVGSIGKIALVDNRLKGFNIVRATARIPVGNEINRLFLVSYLKSQYIQSYFLKETRTVSQPTLNIEHIEKTPVITPSLAEQECFANVVKKYEHLRLKQHESERQAEHLFQSLLQRAFNGEL